MAFSTYDPFVVVDPVTGRPVRASAGKVINPDTGEPVALFDANDVPIDLVVTNNQGYCGGFKTDTVHRSVLAMFGGVTLRKVALEVLERAESLTVSHLGVDTDGTPYFSPGASAFRVVRDSDGTPYVIPA